MIGEGVDHDDILMLAPDRGLLCLFFVCLYTGHDDISMLAPDRGFYLYYPMAMLICFLLLPGQDRTRRHGE
jgi:hypothetical protein